MLHPRIDAAVHASGVDRALTLENEVVVPIAAAELAGMAVDSERLTAFAVAQRNEATAAETVVQQVLGTSVNIRSPQQLIAAVHANLGIELRSTKATDIADQIGEHVVGKELLRYKSTAGLAKTVEGLLDAVGTDGRIHPSFKPLAAATGRMSCSKPNLQSVPKGSGLRECFVPAPGHRFVIADYAAIELRVIAEIIGDAELRRCFIEGIDPHKRTAASVLGKEIGDVTREERGRVKAINFGFCFGMGIHAFVAYARDVYGVIYTIEQATQAREAYFRLYAGIAAWHQRTKCEGKLVARTASGRLRRFDEFRFTEALNQPIQGTAADGMKRALTLLHAALKPLGARLVNVVHDEVVVETPTENADATVIVVRAALVDGMKMFLKVVPVEVEVNVASSWSK